MNYIIKHKILLITLIAASTPIIANQYLTLDHKIFLFSVSDLIRQIIIFLVPLIIFPYIANGILNIGKRGKLLFFIIITGVFVSNTVSLMIPYALSGVLVPLFNVSVPADISQDQFKSCFSFSINSILSVEATVLIAVVVGSILFLLSIDRCEFLEKYSNLVTKVLEKFMPLILPIYIFGSIIESLNKGSMLVILSTFLKMILVVLIIQAIYIMFLFFIGVGDPKKAWKKIKTALEPAIVGFSTMSSLMTMPFTIQAAEKNTNDPELSKVIISSTVNCHDVGDLIFLSMAVLTVFYMYNLSLPASLTYIIFALTLSLAQFGGVSIPGGGSLIIIPLLSSHLGFNADMINLIIILNIIMDPVGTSNNIMGNSAFILIVRRIFIFCKEIDIPQRKFTTKIFKDN